MAACAMLLIPSVSVANADEDFAVYQWGMAGWATVTPPSDIQWDFTPSPEGIPDGGMGSIKANTLPKNTIAFVDGNGIAWSAITGSGNTSQRIQLSPDDFFTVAVGTDSRQRILYIKAKPRNNAKQTAVQLPQSGDPAASWRQQLPLVCAVLAVGAGVIAVEVRRRSA